MREIFGWKWMLFILLGAFALVGCGAAIPPPTGIPPGSPTLSPSPTAALPDSPTAPLATTAIADTPTAAQMPIPSDTPTTEATAPARGNEMPSDPILAQFIRQARADLARRLGISEESIRLIDAKTVEWPDTSLGCPKPGFMYGQIVMPGYLIALGANEKRYEYHADKQRVFLCEK